MAGLDGKHPRGPKEPAGVISEPLAVLSQGPSGLEKGYHSARL